MGHTITIRLTTDLASWLQEESARTGISQGRLIRNELERVRTRSRQRFMRLAGSVSGAKDLSARKGFSRS